MGNKLSDRGRKDTAAVPANEGKVDKHGEMMVSLCQLGREGASARKRPTMPLHASPGFCNQKS